MKTGDKFLHRGWKFLIVKDYGDGTEGTVKIVERGPKLSNVTWVLGEEKRCFIYDGGEKPCTKINEETNMITRKEFNRINSMDRGQKFVSKKEMVEWLKTEGAKLSLCDTKRILEVYFGVKEGDTILSSGGNPPDGSVGVTLDGEKMEKFTIHKLNNSGPNKNVCIFTGGAYYGGAYGSSGIFAFFIKVKIKVLRYIQ